LEAVASRVVVPVNTVLTNPAETAGASVRTLATHVVLEEVAGHAGVAVGGRAAGVAGAGTAETLAAVQVVADDTALAHAVVAAGAGSGAVYALAVLEEVVLAAGVADC
jgi:hypothetical protein